MIRPSKVVLPFLVFLASWLASESHGHEIQLRVPVWDVHKIFYSFTKDFHSSTRPPSRPPTRPTTPTPTPTPTPTMTPTEPSNPTEPSICDIFPMLPACQEETTMPATPPTEPSQTPEPSLCDTFPMLPICQEEGFRYIGNNDIGVPIVHQDWRSDWSLCFYYPEQCGSPEKPQLVSLSDAAGRSLLLIIPSERSKHLPASRLRPTRRPAWQRNYKQS